MKEMKQCFYCIGLTFFFVALQDSVGETEQIKNISASKMKKNYKQPASNKIYWFL